MSHKSIIVILSLDITTETGVMKKAPEVWGSLKNACTWHKWKYNTLARKKPPFVKDGFKIYRVGWSDELVKEIKNGSQ